MLAQLLYKTAAHYQLARFFPHLEQRRTVMGICSAQLDPDSERFQKILADFERMEDKGIPKTEYMSKFEELLSSTSEK